VADAGEPGPIRVEGLKHHLAKTPLRYVPLTERQALVLNARIGKARELELESTLSPRQRKLHEEIRTADDWKGLPMIGRSLLEAWRLTKAHRASR